MPAANLATPGGSHSTDSSLHDEPNWKRKRRARLAQDERDGLERFQRVLPVTHNLVGMHEHWLQQLDARKMPSVARMALELATIPAMSTEAEHIFSGGKHTINEQRFRLADDIIEALECLKSWTREGIVFGERSDIRTVEKMLADLQIRAEMNLE